MHTTIPHRLIYANNIHIPIDGCGVVIVLWFYGANRFRVIANGVFVQLKADQTLVHIFVHIQGHTTYTRLNSRDTSYYSDNNLFVGL